MEVEDNGDGRTGLEAGAVHHEKGTWNKKEEDTNEDVGDDEVKSDEEVKEEGVCLVRSNTLEVVAPDVVLGIRTRMDMRKREEQYERMGVVIARTLDIDRTHSEVQDLHELRVDNMNHHLETVWTVFEQSVVVQTF